MKIHMRGTNPGEKEIQEFEKDFENFLEKNELKWSSDQKEAVVRFWICLFRGNQEQNLTRLISPSDFLYGHLLDVIELERSGFLGDIVMDLGSGCGVPGLLFAAVFPGKKWILAESEKSKAGFLSETAQVLGFGPNQIEVIPTRGELFLKYRSVTSVVSRAVGKIDKLMAWIGDCSTWNNLVLLKGPAWEEEWSSSSSKRRILIESTHSYKVTQPVQPGELGEPGKPSKIDEAVEGIEKQRVIVKLKRKNSRA